MAYTTTIRPLLLISITLCMGQPSCNQNQSRRFDEAGDTTGGRIQPWETSPASSKAEPEKPADADVPAAGPQRAAAERKSSFLKALEQKRGTFGIEKLTVSDISEDDELALGEMAARAIVKRCPPLPPNDPIAIYVRLVGAVLTQHAGRPDIVFRFTVLDSKSLNAFSTPGGYTFITSGLLRYLENEAELAFVLAHEMGHVVKKHGLETWLNGVLDRQKRAMRDRFLERADKDRWRDAEKFAERIDTFADMIIKGKSRPHETAADRYALQLLSRTGYDPHVALSFFKRLAATQKADPFEPPIFQSHPHHEDRFADTRSYLRGLPAGGVRLQERYEKQLKALAAE